MTDITPLLKKKKAALSVYTRGAVVQLNSGGPKMTVRTEKSGDRGDALLVCDYFDVDENPIAVDFFPEQLKEVKDECDTTTS